jgi:hypothetical protein
MHQLRNIKVDDERLLIVVNCFGLKRSMLGAFAKLQNATLVFVTSGCPSVCPHGTTRLPLTGFS